MAGGCSKLIGLSAAGLIVLWLIGSDEAAKEDAATVNRLATEPGDPVTAVELWNAGADNEIGAKQKYSGRVLEVTGVVTLVTTDIRGKPAAVLRGAGRFDSVNVYFRDSEMSLVGLLAKGQSVTVRCADFDMALGSPLVKDCVFPPPPPAVS